MAYSLSVSSLCQFSSRPVGGIECGISQPTSSYHHHDVMLMVDYPVQEIYLRLLGVQQK